jgi:hypothetical protein
MIGGFFHQFGIAAVFRRLFSLAFACRSMFMMLKMNVWDDIGKDTFYRFINSSRINWLKFTSILSAKIVNGVIAKTTDEDRVNVFIVDDTLYERTYSKKTELVSWVYDHVKNVKVRGEKDAQGPLFVQRRDAARHGDLQEEQETPRAFEVFAVCRSLDMRTRWQIDPDSPGICPQAWRN